MYKIFRVKKDEQALGKIFTAFFKISKVRKYSRMPMSHAYVQMFVRLAVLVFELGSGDECHHCRDL